MKARVAIAMLSGLSAQWVLVGQNPAMAQAEVPEEIQGSELSNTDLPTYLVSPIADIISTIKKPGSNELEIRVLSAQEITEIKQEYKAVVEYINPKMNPDAFEGEFQNAIEDNGKDTPHIGAFAYGLTLFEDAMDHQQYGPAFVLKDSLKRFNPKIEALVIDKLSFLDNIVSTQNLRRETLSDFERDFFRHRALRGRHERFALRTMRTRLSLGFGAYSTDRINGMRLLFDESITRTDTGRLDRGDRRGPEGERREEYSTKEAYRRSNRAFNEASHDEREGERQFDNKEGGWGNRPYPGGEWGMFGNKVVVIRGSKQGQDALGFGAKMAGIIVFGAAAIELVRTLGEAFKDEPEKKEHDTEGRKSERTQANEKLRQHGLPTKDDEENNNTNQNNDPNASGARSPDQSEPEPDTNAPDKKDPSKPPTTTPRGNNNNDDDDNPNKDPKKVHPDFFDIENKTEYPPGVILERIKLEIDKVTNPGRPDAYMLPAANLSGAIVRKYGGPDAMPLISPEDYRELVIGKGRILWDMRKRELSQPEITTGPDPAREP